MQEYSNFLYGSGPEPPGSRNDQQARSPIQPAYYNMQEVASRAPAGVGKRPEVTPAQFADAEPRNRMQRRSASVQDVMAPVTIADDKNAPNSGKRSSP